MLSRQKKSEDAGEHFLAASSIGIVANDANLVSIEISEICPVIIRVILRAQARGTLILSAARDGNCVRLIYAGPVGCEQGEHLAIARLVSLVIERPHQSDQRAVIARTLLQRSAPL